MSPKALKVGITGGIGSGKTFICRIFEVLGISVYYADERAKWLQNHDPELTHKIKENFGKQAYDDQGHLDRAFLADTVFSDEKKLALLNQLVHPRVADDYQRWTAQRLSEPYTIKEAALLFETGSYHQLDKVINVDAPQDVRMQRVLQRDPHRSPQQITRIMDRQLSDSERRKRADYNVDNSGNALVIPQVLRIHRELNHKVA